MKVARFVLIFMIMSACIDPLKVGSSNFVSSLVVDGMISDQPGPYMVKLLKTLPIDDQLDTDPTVSGALITISDDQGTAETLKEVNPGVYQTTTTQGAVGRTYTLTIITSQNQTYQSTPETILPLGDFKDLKYKFTEPQDPNIAARSLDTKDGFDIFADATLVPEQQGLVRFRWTGTFEIFTYPSLRLKLVTLRNGQTVSQPDPVPCSGYIVKGGTLQQIAPCTCCTCWVTQYNQDPLVGDSKFIVNNSLSDFQVGFIPANRRYLYDKYYLSVDMMSTSQPVYDFWQKIAAQRLEGGDLFQTTPGVTGSNLIAKTDGSPPVIGVFAAASIKTKTIILYPDELPYSYPGIDTIAEACNQVYPNSVTTRPIFW